MGAIRDASDAPLRLLTSLAGRVAVVTGAAHGIGRACCSRLAEAGANVVLTDADWAAADEAAAELGVRSAMLDVRDAEAIRTVVDHTVAELGRLDVWVNNAGVYPVSPLFELDGEQWDRVVEANLRGTFVGSREAGRAMAALGRGGVIVNVASTAAYRADAPGATHYVTSKFGVRGLTQGLARELGPHGVRVLAVAPTVTLTPGLEEQRASLEAAGFALDELGPELPLGRVAVPDDVARVVFFCASDLSLLMTGCTLPVDAGELA